MLEFQFCHVNKQWTKSSSGNEVIKGRVWNWNGWIKINLNIKIKVSKGILFCKLIFVYMDVCIHVFLL